MNKKIILSLTLFSSTVVTAFAAGCKGGEIKDCITGVGGIIDSLNSSVVTALGTLFLAASVVGFLLGVVRFIWAQQQGDEKGVKSGKETLKWGIIALFCAFSIYGIIKFMQNTLLPVQDPGTIVVPTIQIKTGTGQTTNQGNYPSAPTNQGGYPSAPTNQGNYPSSLNSNNASAGVLNQAGQSFKSQDSATQVNTGSSNQTVDAQKIYNDCIGNGNSASECQGAYSAYGGTGNGQQSQALQAYNECKSNTANTEEECQAVYTAYGGSVE